MEERSRTLWGVAGASGLGSFLILAFAAGYGWFAALLLALLILALVALVLWILWDEDAAGEEEHLHPFRSTGAADRDAEGNTGWGTVREPEARSAFERDRPDGGETGARVTPPPARDAQGHEDTWAGGDETTRPDGNRTGPGASAAATGARFRTQGRAPQPAPEVAPEVAPPTPRPPARGTGPRPPSGAPTRNESHAKARPGERGEPRRPTPPPRAGAHKGAGATGHKSPQRGDPRTLARRSVAPPRRGESPPPAPAPATSSATHASPAATGAGADLLQIRGIGPRTQARLVAHGITDLAALAALEGEQITRLEAALGAPGRITREDWIGQARALLAGREED